MSPDIESELRRRYAAYLPPSTVLDIDDGDAAELHRLLFDLTLDARGNAFEVLEVLVRNNQLCVHVRAPAAPDTVQKALRARTRQARFSPRR